MAYLHLLLLRLVDPAVHVAYSTSQKVARLGSDNESFCQHDSGSVLRIFCRDEVLDALAGYAHS